MKKHKIAAIILTAALSIFSVSANAAEEDNIYGEPIAGSATAYCLHGTTTSGQYTRHGICAGKKEWLGKTAIIYQRLPDGSIGDLIGIYEILDTGGTTGLKTGKVLDIWTDNMDEAQEFMNLVYEDGCKGHVYFYVIDAVG